MRVRTPPGAQERYKMIVSKSFLSQEEITEIEKTFIWSIPWYYHESSANEKYADQISLAKDTKDLSQFVHMFYINGEPKSEYYAMARSIFDAFMNHNNLKYKSILRIKANLITQKNVDSLSHTYPHVDAPYDHHVFIYYINISDGDTVFLTVT